MVHDLFRAAARHVTGHESAHLSKLHHQQERRWLVLPGSADPAEPQTSTPESANDETAAPSALILVPENPVPTGHSYVDRLSRILRRRTRKSTTPESASDKDN